MEVWCWRCPRGLYVSTERGLWGRPWAVCCPALVGVGLSQAGAHRGLVHRWFFEEILGEAEFSLRECFESSLPEQIAHFSSGPDPFVSFRVHWDALTKAAFSGAVEKGLWPRAQTCAAVFVSCFPNNTCKGLKPGLRVGGCLQISGCVFPTCFPGSLTQFCLPASFPEFLNILLWRCLLKGL